MNPELLERLRAMLAAPSDVTRTRAPRPPAAPAIGPRDTTTPTYAPAAPRSPTRAAAETAAGFVPGVEEGINVGRAMSSAFRGDMPGMMGNLLMAGASLVPIPQTVFRGLRNVNSMPDYVWDVTARDIAEAQNPNLQTFLRRSIFQTPEGVPLRTGHGTTPYNTPLQDVEWHRLRLPKQGMHQLGLHTGNPETTAHFAKRMGGRIFPMYARLENPLRLSDYGSWGPRNIRESLETESPELFDALRSRPGMNWLNRESDWDKVSDRTIRNSLQDQGYDGVVYRNRIEGLPRPVREEMSRLRNAYDYYNMGKIPEAALTTMWPEYPDSYIFFSPARQLKSAIGNRGTYDFNSPSLLRGLLLMGGLDGAASAASPEAPDEP